MLKEVSETHLHQLAVNADAYGRGARRFQMRVQGCEYVKLPVSRYRVACLERLRALHAVLTESDRAVVQAPNLNEFVGADLCARFIDFVFALGLPKLVGPAKSVIGTENFGREPCEQFA